MLKRCKGSALPINLNVEICSTFLGSLHSLFAFFTTLTVLKTESVMSKLSPSDVKSIPVIPFHSRPVNTTELGACVLDLHLPLTLWLLGNSQMSIKSYCLLNHSKMMLIHLAGLICTFFLLCLALDL